MSYSSQAAAAYRETKVKTASSGSLILMLYAEVIKQIDCAIEKMNVEKIPASDIELINKHILKAQDIITELMASLDLNAGGKIAENLLSIYSYFNQQLLSANLKKDYKPLVEVNGMLKELQSAWIDIIAKQPQQNTQPVGLGVNIAG